jgi:amidase
MNSNSSPEPDPSAPDEYGAFFPYPDVRVPNAAFGSLAGLRVGVKDLFDVTGYPTGCGHPLRLEQADVAVASAPPVQAMLDAGAIFAGKTHMDELAYSVNGINHHYGAPINTAAVDRITGGSSCGSAAAVAGDLVEIGLGSDTGASVRLPASYCGLFGIRPTHGAVSLKRAMPLSPSFDTVGWLTRDAGTLRQVGQILLPGEAVGELTRLLIADDAFAILSNEAIDAFLPVLDTLRDGYPRIGAAALFPDDLPDRRPAFRIAQSYEAWQSHGDWIKTHLPEIGPGVSDRFRFGSTVSREDYDKANVVRTVIRRFIDDIVGNDSAILLPSAIGPAPLRHTSMAELEAIRDQAQQVLCIASLTGHPQVSIPAVKLDGAPLGMSIIGPRGGDKKLLRLAEQISELRL